MLEFNGSVESPGPWKDRARKVADLPAPLTIPKSDESHSMSGGISLGTPQHRWLLFLGDALLIMLANFLSSWIRFGLFSTQLYVYGLAVAVTLTVYPSTLYVFDLYNLERTFRSWETAFRSSLTVVSGGIISVVVFYFCRMARMEEV